MKQRGKKKITEAFSLVRQHSCVTKRLLNTVNQSLMVTMVTICLPLLRISIVYWKRAESYCSRPIYGMVNVV